MRIVDIRESRHSIASPMRNAFIDFSAMTISLVAVVTDTLVDGKPVVGFGFNSNGRYAQSGLLRERFFPRLLDAEPATLQDEDGFLDPWKVRDTLLKGEKPGGHGERSVAVGIIDMAVWDAVAKSNGLPLAALLCQRLGLGPPTQRVPVYAAGGYYHPDSDLSALRREISSYLDLGYTNIKIKIGGATLDQDIQRILAVIELTGDPAAVAVDANGRLNLSQAIAYAETLEPLGLRWFEEPVDPLDFYALAALADQFAGTLATGENLFSTQDVVNLARFGGMRPSQDILQMDPVLSYGIVEYLDMLDRLAAFGWSASSQIPHGGHQLNLALGAAMKLGGVESYPGIFAPFGGFADGEQVIEGFVAWPEIPGVGLEAKRGLRPLLAALLGD